MILYMEDQYTIDDTMEDQYTIDSFTNIISWMILQIFNIQVNLSTISINRKKIKDTSMARLSIIKNMKLSELAQFYISIICFLIRMLI